MEGTESRVPSISKLASVKYWLPHKRILYILVLNILREMLRCLNGTTGSSHYNLSGALILIEQHMLHGSRTGLPPRMTRGGATMKVLYILIINGLI